MEGCDHRYELSFIDKEGNVSFVCKFCDYELMVHNEHLRGKGYHEDTERA